MTQDYDAFLDRVNAELAREQGLSIPAIYHRVRRIPYGAAGRRDPRAVYENNVGSCSGKHILLRDLLRRAGYEAEVVTMFTNFNKGVPAHAVMAPELRRMIERDEVPDFHHYVRVRDAGGRWLKLDATWHDRLAEYGFPVNAGWRGDGDTVLAAEAIREYPAEEDIAALKLRLLAELTPDQAERRTLFFTTLTGWLGRL